MARDNRRSGPKRRYATPATASNMKTDTRDIVPSADGWSVVQTRVTKKEQRLWKYADKHIPLPPPFPRRPNDLGRPHLRENRHQFVPPLFFARDSPTDLTLRAARKILRSHNIETFQRFAHSLSINTLERPSWHDFGFGPNIRQYALTHTGFAAKVPLFISNDKLMVLDGARSIQFKDWLSTLPFVDGSDLLGVKGYKTLYEWHKARGDRKRCPPLNDDVMQLVLLHAIGEVRPVEHDYHLGYLIERASYYHRTYFARDVGKEIPLESPAVSALDWRLLCLSKALSKMAQRVLRYHTIKRFEGTYILEITALNAPPTFMQCLTSIQLSFSDREYFEFFRVTLPAYTQETNPFYSPTHPPTILRNFPNLRCLELWFLSPAGQITAADYIPWHSINYKMVNGKTTCLYPCRHAIVDCIMCWAYPFINHLSVNITGYAKTATRDHWLHIFRDRRNRESRLIEVEERIKQFEKLKLGDLPRCECKLPCFYDVDNEGLGMTPQVADLGYTNNQDKQAELREEAVKKYKFDFDDDMDVSEIGEDVLALRSYKV